MIGVYNSLSTAAFAAAFAILESFYVWSIFSVKNFENRFIFCAFY